MIRPVCDRCHCELNEPGALAFSPPPSIERASQVTKYHLCVRCWNWFLVEVTGRG